MTSTGSAAALTVEAIAAEFGGRWGIWLSSTGRWWARQEDPGEPGPRPASVLLVRADDPGQLQARIQEQEAMPPVRWPRTSPATS